MSCGDSSEVSIHRRHGARRELGPTGLLPAFAPGGGNSNCERLPVRVPDHVEAQTLRAESTAERQAVRVTPQSG